MRSATRRLDDYFQWIEEDLAVATELAVAEVVGRGKLACHLGDYETQSPAVVKKWTGWTKPHNHSPMVAQRSAKVTLSKPPELTLVPIELRRSSAYELEQKRRTEERCRVDAEERQRRALAAEFEEAVRAERARAAERAAERQRMLPRLIESARNEITDCEYSVRRAEAEGGERLKEMRTAERVAVEKHNELVRELLYLQGISVAYSY